METEILQEEEKEIIDKNSKKKNKKIICGVGKVTSNKIFIDLNGFGIILENKFSLLDKIDKIEITYSGVLNTIDFKIIDYKIK